MKGIGKFLIYGLLLLTTAGIVAPIIARTRQAAQVSECGIRLRMIGIALHNYHSQMDSFPTGTLPNPELRPEQRLSWTVLLWPAYLQGGVASYVDKTKAWDATDGRAVKALNDANIPIVTASPQFIAEIKSRTAGLEKAWADKAKAKSLDGAAALAALRAEIAKPTN